VQDMGNGVEQSDPVSLVLAILKLIVSSTVLNSRESLSISRESENPSLGREKKY